MLMSLYSFYGDAMEVSEESLANTLRSLFLDVSRPEAEMAVHLATLPQGNGTVSLTSLISLLKSLGSLSHLFAHLRQLLELPFYRHVSSPEASCLLQGQPVGTYLVRRTTSEVAFSVCFVEAPSAVAEIQFSWHDKEEGACFWRAI